MSDITPDSTVAVLVERIPLLTSVVDAADGPYSALGDFAIWLRDGIESDSLKTTDVEVAFTFLNDLGGSDNEEVQNQLVVGVLEILTDSEFCVARAKEMLNGSALNLFDRVLRGWKSA